MGEVRAFQAICPNCSVRVVVDPEIAVLFPPAGDDPAAVLFACPACGLHSMASRDELRIIVLAEPRAVATSEPR